MDEHGGIDEFDRWRRGRAGGGQGFLLGLTPAAVGWMDVSSEA